ncbi:MAG: dinitrogenase iron-molybdenum cofactor biosynthesis protein [Coriobacteriia bacterium]|nr:dinitrogenase iron-molybdenum cofactor biosynthesis protein [Coriobacteriia bacterium]
MSDRIRLAVPTVGEGGLKAERSGHFGHCDCFTVIDMENGEIVEVSVVGNPPHVEGGCLAPVNLLASHGVNALVAGGMGARPLMGFKDVGIRVFFDNQTPGVGDVVSRVLQGELPVMELDNACGGGNH